MLCRVATDAWAVQSFLGTLLARTLPACCHKGVQELAMNKLRNWLIHQHLFFSDVQFFKYLLFKIHTLKFGNFAREYYWLYSRPICHSGIVSSFS